ncbi:MAG: ABC transporter ATP-binding protein [Candidatus Thorarchaeota archaeon]
MSKLQLKNISISFGKVNALRNINLDIQKGEYLVILGPSGAGKTTLLKVISGLYKPTKGQILLDNQDITFLPPEDRKIALLPQNYALFPKMDVWENTSFSGNIQGLSKEKVNELSKEILTLVHLLDRSDAYPDELSGGMKQRTALARSLASNFKVLLLDEPLRALDARLRIELRTELKKLVQDLDFTVLHVTHDQEEAMAIADRIVVLNYGMIHQIGTQEELYYYPSDKFVANFMGEVNQLEVKVNSKEIITSKGNSELNNQNFKYMYILSDQNSNLFYTYSNQDFHEKEEVKIFTKTESIRLLTMKVYQKEKELSKNKKSQNKHKSEDEDDFDENSNRLDEKLGNNLIKNYYHSQITNKYYLGKWTNIQIKFINKNDTHVYWLVKLPSRKAVKLGIGIECMLHVPFEAITMFLK